MHSKLRFLMILQRKLKTCRYIFIDKPKQMLVFMSNFKTDPALIARSCLLECIYLYNDFTPLCPKIFRKRTECSSDKQ